MQLNQTMKTHFITRNQLKGYGATHYQAVIITKNLKPIYKLNRSNVYSLQEVIAYLKKYLKNSKIRQKTKISLTCLLPILVTQLDNVVHSIFGNSVNKELGQSAKNLFLKMTSLDKRIINSKAQIANIKGKRKK
jgi:hypothetical protein